MERLMNWLNWENVWYVVRVGILGYPAKALFFWWMGWVPFFFVVMVSIMVAIIVWGNWSDYREDFIDFRLYFIMMNPKNIWTPPAEAVDGLGKAAMMKILFDGNRKRKQYIKNRIKEGTWNGRL